MVKRSTIKKQYRQSPVPGTNKVIDRAHPAKLPGWRRSEDTGEYYFENRENRSDTAKEQKYHGGSTLRRAAPNSGGGKTSSVRRGRIATTTTRTAPIRKYDVQKPRIRVLVTAPPFMFRSGTGGKRHAPVRTEKISRDQLEIIIRRREAAICDKPIEHLIIFDTKGNVVFTKTGNKTRVIFNYPELETGTEKYILTHNHPSGSTFSGADIAALLRCGNLLEIRACYTGRVYICRRGTAVETSTGMKRLLDNAYKKVAKRVSENFIEKHPFKSTKFRLKDDYMLWVNMKTHPIVKSEWEKETGNVLANKGFIYKKVIV